MSSVNTGAERPRRMRAPRLLEVVLVLSLAFNAFIAGGFLCSVWFFGHPPGPPAEKHLDELARALGVDKNAPPFVTLRDDLHAQFEILHQKNGPLTAPLWAEVSKPQPDPQHIQQLLAAITVNREAFQRRAAQDMIAFVLQLDPDQRAAFIRLASDRKNPQGQPIRGLLGN
jgi:hypothetical protein